MTKEELTKEIAKRVKDIRELYNSVYPEGEYLSLYFEKDVVSFNNSYMEGAEDEYFPINYYENEMYIRMNEEYKEKKC